MRGAERVVFALGALGETGQAAALAQRADAVAAVGEDLVRIGLMADVPNEPVGRRIEHVVQRDGQLDDAEPGAEMAAGDGDRVDRLAPQFVCDLPQLTRFEASEVLGGLNLVEQWGLGRNRHATLLISDQCVVSAEGRLLGLGGPKDGTRRFRRTYTILRGERNLNGPAAEE